MRTSVLIIVCIFILQATMKVVASMHQVMIPKLRVKPVIVGGWLVSISGPFLSFRVQIV